MATRLVVEVRVNGLWVDVHNEDIKLTMTKEQIKESAVALSRTINHQIRIRKVVEKVLFTTPTPAIKVESQAA
jgi:hypothetical protein